MNPLDNLWLIYSKHVCVCVGGGGGTETSVNLEVTFFCSVWFGLERHVRPTSLQR